MKSTLSKVKKINILITNRIIELQDKGYLYDFMSIGKKRFLCLQDSVCFHAPDVSVKLVDQVYDHLTKCYKYLHTVETATGHKGVLLDEGIKLN